MVVSVVPRGLEKTIQQLQISTVGVQFLAAAKVWQRAKESAGDARKVASP